VNVGASASFLVEASGSAPLAYQWFFKSNLIAGATNTLFSVASAQATDIGGYSVVVTTVLAQPRVVGRAVFVHSTSVARDPV
jgi:hypothetical protein